MAVFPWVGAEGRGWGGVGIVVGVGGGRSFARDGRRLWVLFSAFGRRCQKRVWGTFLVCYVKCYAVTWFFRVQSIAWERPGFFPCVGRSSETCRGGRDLRGVCHRARG